MFSEILLTPLMKSLVKIVSETWEMSSGAVKCLRKSAMCSDSGGKSERSPLRRFSVVEGLV